MAKHLTLMREPGAKKYQLLIFVVGYKYFDLALPYFLYSSYKNSSIFLLHCQQILSFIKN